MFGAACRKLRERRGLVGLMVLAAVPLYFASDLAWSGLTHRGPGLSFGGADKDGISIPDSVELIPESQFRREHLAAAGMSLFFGAVFAYCVIKTWLERDKFEKVWDYLVANPEILKRIRERPDNEKYRDEVVEHIRLVASPEILNRIRYRYDFVEWIRKNHPDAGI